MRTGINLSNRFLLSDYPHLADICFTKEREVTHPIAKVFEDLPLDQQAVCKRIKELILEKLPFAGVYLFGSRIKGNWVEDSDYDIVVTGTVQCHRELVKDIDFGVRVDLFFSPGNTMEHYVEII